jgi:N4-gp56 family major capsid protein
MSITTYGDISPRTAAFAVAQMLKRGLPYLCLEKFGQTYPIPKNNTKTAKFRRYFLSGSTGSAGNTGSGPLSNFYTQLALTPLVEGVTPAGRQLSNQDYQVTLAQYGDFVTITDVVMDTHEDKVLKEATDILGEQAAQTVETLRFNVLKAGLNAFYANGVAGRVNVSAKIELADQRRVTAALARQNAKMITQIVKSTPDFRTEPVEAAYVAYCHTDVENDLRSVSGFTPTKQYGTTPQWENEIGAIEKCRYLTSTIAAPWADAATSGTLGSLKSTTGTYADVYPVLYLGRDAFGHVPLKGENSLAPMVVNPKPAPGDPLAQRGTVGWKTWHAAIILNDAWMARLEVGVTA